MNFKKSLDTIGLPVITLTQNEDKYNFLVDSGADSSLINAKHLKNIFHKPVSGSRKIYGIDGSPQESGFIQAEFFLNNEKVSDVFQLIDVPGLDNIAKDDNVVIIGILGSSFLNKYSFLIDYKQHTISVNKKDLKRSSVLKKLNNKTKK